ncbi:MAG: hypothetical protein Q7J10_02530 [Methanosarcinaceae archaeon]|nr:hypothetical protein [Methanosarcinaceae archaeon]
MNKIDKLIIDLCPEGVEFKELGEIASYIRGVTYGKKDETQSNDGWKILRSSQTLRWHTQPQQSCGV